MFRLTMMMMADHAMCECQLARHSVCMSCVRFSFRKQPKQFLHALTRLFCFLRSHSRSHISPSPTNPSIRLFFVNLNGVWRCLVPHMLANDSCFSFFSLLGHSYFFAQFYFIFFFLVWLGSVPQNRDCPSMPLAAMDVRVSLPYQKEI